VLEQILVGAIAFASTNIDDILLLAVFFGQRGRRVPSIVAGQFLGIGALVVLSIVAALAALVVPPRWPALLGLLPLALGLHQLPKRAAPKADQPSSASGLWAVASVTAANGGDNLGIYIPLFASGVDAIPVYVVVFAVGTALWCSAGYLLVQQPHARNALDRYGHQVVPWVLIGIGGYVLSNWWRT
jgi:cadmium resistance protein CadD (predicted permease)